MSVIYRYSRYFVEGKEDYDTKEEAIKRACYDIDRNNACPIEILSEDGVVLVDYNQILEAFQEYSA